MKKIAFVFGTRPEFIKIYPVIMEAKSRDYEVVVINTGQHKEMMTMIIEHFDLKIDYDLEIMDKCNGLVDILSIAIKAIDDVIKMEKPDLIFVHGDTSATLAGSLVGFYNHIKVAHIEAGLRTGDKFSPFPEEMNRILTGSIADFHFAPTQLCVDNLKREDKNIEEIFIVGNSAIDMFKYTLVDDYHNEIIDWIKDNKMILITIHRRESLSGLEDIFRAINDIAIKYPDFKFVYPIHLNPIIRKMADKVIKSSNIRIIEPMGVYDFHNLISHSYFILTDSGGIQEEAPSLGKPVLVVRDNTERPEGVDVGTLKIIGTTYEKIVKETTNLIENEQEYIKMSSVKNPYGDGTTSLQIMDIIEEKL